MKIKDYSIWNRTNLSLWLKYAETYKYIIHREIYCSYNIWEEDEIRVSASRFALKRETLYYFVVSNFALIPKLNPVYILCSNALRDLKRAKARVRNLLSLPSLSTQNKTSPKTEDRKLTLWKRFGWYFF